MGDQSRKPNDIANYSNAVKTNPAKATDVFQQAVLSAVHVVNQRKAVGQKNVIVAGLPASAETNASQDLDVNADAARHLLESELNVRVNIISCQRLGTQVPGTVRPQVSLSSTEDAMRVLFLAKHLRRS
jgi:hypothetical protein